MKVNATVVPIEEGKDGAGAKETPGSSAPSEAAAKNAPGK
jgi:hypothetical protein